MEPLAIPLTLASSPTEESILLGRSEELIGYVESTLLNTFSHRQARKQLQHLGLSRTTAESVVRWIESQPSIRHNISTRYHQRMVLSLAGLIASTGISLIPSVRTVFVGAIACCAVYALFSFIGWRRYRQPVFAR
jgi:hypothetical protein